MNDFILDLRGNQKLQKIFKIMFASLTFILTPAVSIVLIIV